MPAHASQEELRLAFAAGALPAAPALVLATQMALDPACRREVAALESIGGLLLEDMAPAALAAGTRERVMAALDLPLPPLPGVAGDGRLPTPLAALLPAPLERLPWRRVTRSLKDWILPEMAGGRARLMWVAGGTAIPRHTHRGLELTLVLEGAYRDGERRFARGDLQLADDAVDHQPLVSEPAPCLCLVVTEAPVRLTGRIGRYLNRFVRY